LTPVPPPGAKPFATTYSVGKLFVEITEEALAIGLGDQRRNEELSEARRVQGHSFRGA
jgi:hypothetical protein